MIEIQLTKGYKTIVDESDYIFVSAFKWYAQTCPNGKVYAARQKTISISPKKQRTQLLTRFLFGLDDSDKRMIDHINHDTLDNRRENLRVCSRSQNCMNSIKKVRNGKSTSKYKGVYFHENRWVAYIYNNKKQVRIGIFDKEEDAALAYNKKANEIQGEFALLNEVSCG